jgi:hypothetical protein
VRRFALLGRGAASRAAAVPLEAWRGLTSAPSVPPGADSSWQLEARLQGAWSQARGRQTFPRRSPSRLCAALAAPTELKGRSTAERRHPGGLQSASKSSIVPLGVGSRSSERREARGSLYGQMRLAEDSQSRLKTGEDTPSLHREDVARVLNTAKDERLDRFHVAKVHGGSAQPIRR